MAVIANSAPGKLVLVCRRDGQVADHLVVCFRVNHFDFGRSNRFVLLLVRGLRNGVLNLSGRHLIESTDEEDGRDGGG